MALPSAPAHPWQLHPSLTALRDSLQITADCWALLAAPDGSSRKEHYLPKGEREPDRAYPKRLDAARPSGFFRDALRTYAGMLSRGSWLSLPASLSSVLTDVDGCGTDLGVFLAAADLLVSRRRIPRPMCSSTPPTCSKKRSRPATAPAPARPSCRRTDAVGRGREPATSPPLHKPLQSLQRTETSMADPAPRFGFVDFAETWNGRLAMLGFVIGLATELLTGQGILQQIGLG